MPVLTRLKEESFGEDGGSAVGLCDSIGGRFSAIAQRNCALVDQGCQAGFLFLKTNN